MNPTTAEDLVNLRFNPEVSGTVFNRMLEAWIKADAADRATQQARYAGYLAALSADPRGQVMAHKAALAMTAQSLTRTQKMLKRVR